MGLLERAAATAEAALAMQPDHVMGGRGAFQRLCQLALAQAQAGLVEDARATAARADAVFEAVLRGTDQARRVVFLRGRVTVEIEAAAGKAADATD